MPSTLNIAQLNDNPSPRRIIIVGGGIVGAALAFHLSKAESENHIILIDKSLETLLGSTGHAPGFVGQLNESPVLTRLAKDRGLVYPQSFLLQRRPLLLPRTLLTPTRLSTVCISHLMELQMQALLLLTMSTKLAPEGWISWKPL